MSIAQVRYWLLGMPTSISLRTGRVPRNIFCWLHKQEVNTLPQTKVWAKILLVSRGDKAFKVDDDWLCSASKNSALPLILGVFSAYTVGTAVDDSISHQLYNVPG